MEAVSIPVIAPVLAVRFIAPLQLSFIGAGAGMLKAFETTPFKEKLLKEIVALVTPAVLVAVSPENVATPDVAFIDIDPPILQTLVSVEVAVINALLVVRLPY